MRIRQIFNRWQIWKFSAERWRSCQNNDHLRHTTDYTLTNMIISLEYKSSVITKNVTLSRKMIWNNGIMFLDIRKMILMFSIYLLTYAFFQFLYKCLSVFQRLTINFVSMRKMEIVMKIKVKNVIKRWNNGDEWLEERWQRIKEIRGITETHAMIEYSFFRTEPEFVRCCLRERAKRVRRRAWHVFLTESKDAL